MYVKWKMMLENPMMLAILRLVFSPRCDPFFVVLQKWNFHQGALRVSAMNHLAVVTQSLLCEPFRALPMLCDMVSAGVRSSKSLACPLSWRYSRHYDNHNPKIHRRTPTTGSLTADPKELCRDHLRADPALSASTGSNQRRRTQTVFAPSVTRTEACRQHARCNGQRFPILLSPRPAPFHHRHRRGVTAHESADHATAHLQPGGSGTTAERARTYVIDNQQASVRFCNAKYLFPSPKGRLRRFFELEHLNAQWRHVERLGHFVHRRFS